MLPSFLLGSDIGQSPQAWYHTIQHHPSFIDDPHQAYAIERLEQLHRQLILFKKVPWPLGKCRLGISVPKGIYLYGGVGRGKSLLMDAFFAGVPSSHKRRVHFHAFMQEVQHALHEVKGVEDPLQVVADRIAKSAQLICLDELQVSDVAQAMMLSRLFAALFERGIIFVITSNDAPEKLYPHGLQRMHFLSTIALLQEKLEVIAIEGETDYRLRALARAEIWLSPLDGTTDQRLDMLFSQWTNQDNLPVNITVNGRLLQSKRRTNGVIWFTFATLCMSHRAQADYLVLAQNYHTVFLSDIPCLQTDDNMRRFIWLVDIFYNERVKLIISSAVSLDAFYPVGREGQAFKRTRSRLEEMQSREYLGV